MTAPYFTQRQMVAVKIETTEGVDAVPTDGDVVAPLFGAEYTPTVESNEREVLQDSFSRISRVSGEQSAEISFSVEIRGAGSAGTAPNIGQALQACGFDETVVPATSVTYGPISESIPSVTVELREGSTDATVYVKKIIGARGTVTFTAEKGGMLMANFTFTGKYVEPAEAGAQFTAPALSTNPLPFLNVGLNFLGVGSLIVQAVELDMGNEVTLHNDVNDATGNTGALIVGRTPVGTLNPELTDFATINFFNKLTTDDEGTLSFALTGAAGNIVTVTATNVQITSISEDDRDGIRVESLDLVLNQGSAVGDDEISLVFT